MSEAHAVTVLYHADCIDGFGSAFAAWQHFGSRARYQALHHGQTLNLGELAGRAVFILDFSFAPEMLRRMAATAASVTQIDHHASARLAWATHLSGRADQLATHTDPELPLTVMFDLNKSGARLAWEYFHGEAPVPLTLQHIEDQDLWRFTLPNTRFFCRALRLLPFDFATWKQLMIDAPAADSPRYREMLSNGQAIELFFQKEIERLAASHLRMPARLRGEPVDALQAVRHGQETITDGDLAWLTLHGIAINASVLFASELGNLLAEQNGSFGLIWQLAGDGEVKASLRSKGDFDVAAIATRYGGGGHRNAAGFRMPHRQFLTEVLGQ